MKRLVLAAAVALLCLSSAHADPGGRVAGSKHDLSAAGPGTLRATRERSACIFCHVSHQSGPSLSNRPESDARYRAYESTTMETRPGVPTGSSRVCLSCHDGTIAVGRTLTGAIEMAGGTRPIGPDRKANLGTDLRASHPVSFRPGGAHRTHLPPTGDEVSLDRLGALQCTACHDPHAEYRDPVVGKFLVKRSERSALCLSCHDRLEVDADDAGHARSTAAMPAELASPFGSIADAGCSACHASHGAETRGRLLRGGKTDDDDCLACHDRSAVGAPIGKDLRKRSAHASTTRGRHDPAEGAPAAGRQPLPETSVGAPRHVACADCHDPHKASARPATAPAANGRLAGTWGIDLEGNRVEPARNEFEVCFKCHGDSANKPQGRASVAGRPQRLADDLNLRRVFDPAAPSSHPVVAPGKRSRVPGLKAPYAEGTHVYCTDCHASDESPSAGGGGARGPHGSIYEPLLERPYETTDFTVEGPSAYGLCYKCHDREILFSAASGFTTDGGVALHLTHVRGEAAPCSACHDAHGVSAQLGNATGNAHLIDFDVNIVKAGSGAIRQYVSQGAAGGSCNLTCHTRPHDGSNGSY